MSKPARRPRAIITCGNFRLVRGSQGFNFVEERDGKDATRVQRWKAAKFEGTTDFRSVIDDIVASLVDREKRARARRKK